MTPDLSGLTISIDHRSLIGWLKGLALVGVPRLPCSGPSTFLAMSMSWYIPALVSLLVILAISFITVPPRNLAHLPRAPILELLKSYVSGEIESERIKRIVLPFANEHGHPLVLVWAFGMWIVHVIDFEVRKSHSALHTIVTLI